MQALVEKLSHILALRGYVLVTAESCTGGMVAMAITEQAGSSAVFDRGFVTYSNESKHQMLGVSREILENKGAVSPECAKAMVQGALDHSPATLALSITGIAGPGGATARKPVGLVYTGCGMRDGEIHVETHHFSGDRASIREQSAKAVLNQAIAYLETTK